MGQWCFSNLQQKQLKNGSEDLRLVSDLRINWVVVKRCEGQKELRLDVLPGTVRLSSDNCRVLLVVLPIGDW